MIFLNNVYITNEPSPFSSGYDRGNLPNNDKLDIYKYSLASLSNAYPWKRAIIFFELHEEYHDREQELIEFIKEEFKGIDLILRNTRNEYVSDWIDTYDLLNDELIWFCCNHDHIYMDNTDYLENYIHMFRKNYSNTLSSIFFSHWPEMLSHVSDGSVEKVDGQSVFKISTNTRICSIQIITKKLYKSWWIDGWEHIDTSKIFLPRSDHAKSIYDFKNLESFELFVPSKEICRHFDGYGHTRPAMSNKDCPALSIPEGFFENNIKINFNVDKDRNKCYTYFDPLCEKYYAWCRTGTDYKWCEDDIPKFWNSRISSIQSRDIPEQEIKQAKINNLITLVFSNAKYHNNWHQKIKQKLLNQIMKEHGFYRSDK